MKTSLTLNGRTAAVAVTLVLSQTGLAAQPKASAFSSKKPGNTVTQKSGKSAAITSGTASKLKQMEPSNATTVAGSTTAVIKPSWRDTLSSVLVSNVAGPAIGNPGTSQTDTATGQLDPSSPIRTENSLLLGMRLANGASIGAAANFVYTPVDETGFQMQDPFLSISKPLVERGPYNLRAQLRAYAPVSEGSQRANLIGRARLVINQTYSPSGSRWSAGIFSYAQSYVYNANRSAGATRTKFLLEPSINYQIKPNLTAGVLYDMLARNRYNDSFFSFSPADETALSPNVSWDVNQRLNLSPYLSIPTGKRVALDTTTINLLLSMRLL